MFESFPRLLGGLLVGVVFGFLLQKGRVAKFHVIVRQFTFQDWTVAKIMGTAIIVGGVGIYALLPVGAVELHVKPLLLGGVLVGGLLFGIGLVVFGYCPGTGVAACGEGRRDAMVGLIGGIAGAGAFVLGYGALQPVIQWGDLGKITLPSVTNLSGFIWLGIFATVALVAGVLVRGRRAARPPAPARPLGLRRPVARRRPRSFV